MNIKSLLIGSAAALAAVSGAQAADAIVAAEPEPLEYVRVCDAFGAGYFYIPGTETCLRIGGEVRFTAAFGEDIGGAAPGGRSSDWNSQVRARVFFDTKTDSELGTIGTYIRLQGDYRPRDAGTEGVELEQGYITIGGLKVGKALTWWDDIGINGELDAWDANTNFNTISYLYDAGAFRIGLGLDDISDAEDYAGIAYAGSELGIQGYAQVDFGAANLALRGVYDTEAEEGSIYATLVAPIGPGELNVAAAWSSGENIYVDGFRGDAYEWTVSGSYALKATDKLTVTPGVSYWSTQSNNDIWGVGVLAEYQLATGLKVGATVNYVDPDAGDDVTSGWVRLTRSF
jgi:opacity protein-like surface antigen